MIELPVNPEDPEEVAAFLRVVASGLRHETLPWTLREKLTSYLHYEALQYPLPEALREVVSTLTKRPGEFVITACIIHESNGKRAVFGYITARGKKSYRQLKADLATKIVSVFREQCRNRRIAKPFIAWARDGKYELLQVQDAHYDIDYRSY